MEGNRYSRFLESKTDQPARHHRISPVSFLAANLAALLVTLGVAVCAGRVVLGGRQGLAVSCAAGFAIVAHLLFALAALGWLNRTAIVVVGGGLVIAGALRSGWEWPRLHWSLLAIIPIFMLALCPPVEFDETLYHLPHVRALAETGVLGFRADLRFPVFPLLQELLAVPAFLFAGDVATHMLPLAEGIATVALLIEWGRQRGTHAGLLAAAAFAGGPIVVHLSTSLYIEAGLTLFVTAAFYCLDRKWLLGAGLFLGTACGVKYLALYFAGVAGLWVLLATKPRLRNAAIFSAGVLAAAFPTYLWIFLQTGDPLFPFLRANAWTPQFPARGLMEHVLAFVRIPWNVTFARFRVGFQPPFTPLFALALVGIAAGAVRDARVRAVACITAGYFIVFASVPPDSRYLMPLLPVVFFAAAAMLRLRPSLVPWIVALALLPGPAYAIHRLVRHGLPPFTPAQRTSYLERRLPEYRALRRVGAHSVYACGVERLKYYAEGPFYGDVFGPYTFGRVRPDFVLASKIRCGSWSPGPGFVPIYEDGAARLWRRVESRR
jgi:hypothetical protein